MGMERAAESGEYSRRAESEHAQAVAHLEELKAVKDAASAALASQQDAVARERAARAELAKVSTAARIQASEFASLKKQNAELTAELQRCGTLAAEDARRAHALQHQIDISEQEVAMLENERGRLFREQDAVATTVTKLDRVV